MQRWAIIGAVAFCAIVAFLSYAYRVGCRVLIYDEEVG
jgi:hypothetical protein